MALQTTNSSRLGSGMQYLLCNYGEDDHLHEQTSNRSVSMCHQSPGKHKQITSVTETASREGQNLSLLVKYNSSKVAVQCAERVHTAFTRFLTPTSKQCATLLACGWPHCSCTSILPYL
eukprot:5113974-Amphidinium_carterae.1